MKNKRPKRRVRYWHGLGRCRDPLTVRRIETAEMLGLPVRPDAPPDSGEYVYASTTREVALAFSTLSGGQAICEIRPEPLRAQRDPDFPTLGVRFHGPVKAVSVHVVNPTDLPSARQIIKTLGVDYLWSDHTPQYSEDGYLQTPPVSRAHGYQDEDFRWLGPWWPSHFLFPRPTGIEMVLDETGQPHVMYPPDHPDLNGRRRIPRGTLEHAWNQPGYYPNHTDMLHRLSQRNTMGDPTLAPIRKPWEW